MLVLDDFSLLRVAKAMTAQENGHPEEVWSRLVGVSDFEKYSIPSLKKSRDLRLLLIEFLEAKIEELDLSRRKYRDPERISAAIERKRVAWDRFSFMRRLAATDCVTLQQVKHG